MLTLAVALGYRWSVAITFRQDTFLLPTFFDGRYTARSYVTSLIKANPAQKIVVDYANIDWQVRTDTEIVLTVLFHVIASIRNYPVITENELRDRGITLCKPSP